MKKNNFRRHCALIITATLFLIQANAQAGDNGNDSSGKIEMLDGGGGYHLPCIPPAPSGLFADSIKSTSAKLHATVNHGFFVGFYYKSQSSATFIFISGGDPTWIYDLLQGTTYEYYAVEKCTNQNGTRSTASPHSYFTTLQTGISVTKSAINLNVYPNPVSTSVNFSFTLLQSEKVSVKVFDMTGRLVKTIVDAEMTPGAHQLEWNMTVAKIISGIYFLKIETKNYSETKKISVIK